MMTTKERKVFKELVKSLASWMEPAHRLWVEKKPGDDDPLVKKVQETQKLLAEANSLLGE